MQSPDKQRFRFTTGLLLLISIAVLASVTSSTPTQTLGTTEGAEGTNGSMLLTAPAGPQAASATNLPRNADPTAGSAAISPAANPRGEGSRFNNTSATVRVGEEGAGGAMTAPDSNGAANGGTPEGGHGGRGANGHGTPEGDGAANGAGTGEANGHGTPEGGHGTGAANGAGTGGANGAGTPEGGHGIGAANGGTGASNGKAPEGDLGGRGANGAGTGATDGAGGGTPPGSDGARDDGTTDSETRTSDPFGLADDLLKQTDDAEVMPPFTGVPLNRPALIIRNGLAGTKEQPRLYLTFDDGPHPHWTPRFLDLLDRYGARATFFLVGEWAAAYPNLVREIVERGHTLGNHLWSHTDAPFRDEELFRREVRNTAAALGEGITNCLRPPFGTVSKPILDWSGEEGYEVVLWSYPDIRDWHPENDVETLREGLAQIQEGGTILLLHEHSGNKTLTALDEALASLTSRGWQVDTPICPLDF